MGINRGIITMTVCALGRCYPSYLILITISVLVSSSSSSATNNETKEDVITTGLEDNKSVSFDTMFKQEDGQSTNVPIRMCDSTQQRKYADLTTVHLSPPCESAYQGFCGIRRNQNYTLVIKFLAKVQTKSLSVQVTTIDPTFGWETQLLPEFSVCSPDFNITCPQNPNNLVQAFLHDSLPEEFLAMRALVRIRLFGMDKNDIRRLYICRQLNLQIY